MPGRRTPRIDVDPHGLEPWPLMRDARRVLARRGTSSGLPRNSATDGDRGAHPARALLLAIQALHLALHALAPRRGHQPDFPPRLDKATETV